MILWRPTRPFRTYTIPFTKFIEHNKPVFFFSTDLGQIAAYSVHLRAIFKARSFFFSFPLKISWQALQLPSPQLRAVYTFHQIQSPLGSENPVSVQCHEGTLVSPRAFNVFRVLVDTSAVALDSTCWPWSTSRWNSANLKEDKPLFGVLYKRQNTTCRRCSTILKMDMRQHGWRDDHSSLRQELSKPSVCF